MSADNCIACLKCKDGYRVTHAQAIDNLTWWDDYRCCDNPKVEWEELTDDTCDYLFSSPICKNCGAKNPENKGGHREELNPQILKEYFGDCIILTEEEANNYIEELCKECDYLEYGVLTFEYNNDFPR